MAVIPKDHRVPVMMTEAEVQAIDDWRFNSRVATRAEAIRRLVELGLTVGAPVEASR